MMKYIFLMIIAICLTSCAMTTRTVTMPDQSVYTVTALKDDMVTCKQGDTEISMDGRGRPGMIEQIMGIMFLNLPDVTVGTD